MRFLITLQDDKLTLASRLIFKMLRRKITMKDLEETI